MLEGCNAIAIIPSDCFRWVARVQFIESFRTRAAAINFASQQGYNLIVERNEGSSALFDVMDDPDGTCTAGLELELLKAEDVLVEPPPTGWTMLMVWTLWGLAKRFATLSARLYVRQVVPLFGRAAVVAGTNLRAVPPLSKRFAGLVEDLYVREITPLSRRIFAFVSMHLRKAAPISQRAAAVASAYLQESAPIRRGMAALAGLYLQGIVSRRHAASRIWWSDRGIAFRRVWRRHSHGTAGDLARRFAAISSVYLRENTRRLGDAVRRCRWSDVEAALRQVRSNALSTGCDLGRRFATAANTYVRQIAPIYRHTAAFASLFLREISPLSRRVSAVARTHFLEIASMLRDAAAKCWSESKSGSHHSWAVATIRHSNPSQLR